VIPATPVSPYLYIISSVGVILYMFLVGVGNLPFSRNRVSQCFAHHAPMNPQLLRHPLDRSCTVRMLTPDLFK
jgi:hypothetical protein